MCVKPFKKAWANIGRVDGGGTERSTASPPYHHGRKGTTSGTEGWQRLVNNLAFHQQVVQGVDILCTECPE